MQISLFDGSKPFKIDKPVRLIELFAGIGSQAKALANLNVDFEHYRICEFDKYAVQSYNAVHGTRFKTSDITKIKAEDLGIIDTDKFCYIMTYSFPCQDLSNAGKQAGMAKGSGTRSGLLWEVERLLDECKELPQVLLMENVPAVIGSANIEHFAKWQEKLESVGYKNKWQILNAKDYGIPQNRERCFMVSVLGDYYYEFPDTIPLKLRLKDMLESNVDEKYYLSDRIIDYFTNHSKECEEKGNGFRFEPTNGDCISKCITTRAGGRMDDNFIKEEPNLKRELCNNLVKNGLVEEDDIIRHSYTKSRMQGEMKDIKEKGLCPTLDTRCDCLGITVKEETDKCNCIGTLQGGKWDKMHDIARRVYSPNGLSPTIHTCGGGNLEPKVICGIGEKKSNNGTQWYRQDRVYDNNIATSITTDFNPYYVEPMALDEQNNYIRQDGCVGTLTTDGSSPKHNNRIIEPKVWDGFNQQVRADSSVVGTLTQNCGSDLKRNGQGIIEGLRIRKLTPKECWRLMGFSDSDIDKAIAIGMSNAQLYKQAGNSIVVNVLMAIFGKMI